MAQASAAVRAAALPRSSQVERYVETLDKRVAAIGIARVVRLRYTRDDMANAVLAGIDSSDTQEEEVAAGHDGL